MTRKMLPVALGLSSFAALPALAADGMRFKNNVLPGHLTIHTIARLTQRTVPRQGETVKLSYAQAADYVQCNIDQPQAGAAGVYQMVCDGEAKVVSYFRGAESIKPLPPAEQFNLPKGSVRLYKNTVYPHDAPYLIPRGDEAEQAVLRTVLDFAHWPKDKIESSHRWQRDISDGGFRGTQTFEFAGLDRIDDQAVAVVRLKIEGEFDAPLDKRYRFGVGKIMIHWLRLERTLLKLEGSVDYKRVRPGGVEEAHKLEISVTLKALRSLDENERDAMIDQLTVFAHADRMLREGDEKAVMELFGRFASKWPKSLWRPAFEELVAKARPRRSPKRLKTSEIEALLGNGFVIWESALREEDFELMDRTRESLAGLVKDYHSKLYKFLREEDNKTRAAVIFAMAFSENDGDFQYVQKAVGDRSRYVRAAALAGLAARASPQTSAEGLIAALDDKQASVRLRACRAVAACVPREHYSIARVVEKLVDRMMHDDKAGVRREAIQAIATIGAPADIPKLVEAMTHELNKENRAEIEKAIEKLEAMRG